MESSPGKTSPVDGLVAVLEPGSRGNDDDSYIALRRMLLHRQAIDGKLKRQAWKYNGIGYISYRQYIRKLRQWDNHETPEHSDRWTSRCFSNGNKGPPSFSSSISRQQSFSSFASESDRLECQTGSFFSGLSCRFDQCKASVNVIRFGHLSADLLAFGASDGTLYICSVATPPQMLHCLRGHSKEITDFDWSLSNHYICSSSMDRSVRVWDAEAGQCVRVIYDKSSQLCVRFHPTNNNYLIVGTGNDEIKAINFSTGRCLHKVNLERSITAMDIDHSGRILFAGDSQGCIHSLTVDSRTGKLSRAHKNSLGLAHKSTTTTIQFRIFSLLAGGPVLLAANQDGSLRFFSVALEVKGYLTLRCSLHLSPHARNIRASFCSVLSLEKGEFIVSGNEDKNIYFYDFTRPKHPCVNKLRGHAVPVVGVCWNYGESLLASSDCEGLVLVWKRT